MFIFQYRFIKQIQILWNLRHLTWGLQQCHSLKKHPSFHSFHIYWVSIHVPDTIANHKQPEQSMMSRRIKNTWISYQLMKNTRKKHWGCYCVHTAIREGIPIWWEISRKYRHQLSCYTWREKAAGTERDMNHSTKWHVSRAMLRVKFLLWTRWSGTGVLLGKGGTWRQSQLRGTCLDKRTEVQGAKWKLRNR